MMNNVTIPPNTPYPVFGNLVVGTYTFRLLVEDDATPRATHFDDMIVTVNPSNQPITATLTATPNNLPAGGGVTQLVWSSQNATACSSSEFNTNGDTQGGPLTVFVPGTTTYNIVCTGSGATPATASATVIVQTTNPGPVTALIDAFPYTLPFGGGNSTLVWDTNGTSCTGINFNTGGLPTGSKVVTLSSTTTYEVYCTDGLLTAQDDVTVTVSGNNNPINGMCGPSHWLCSGGTSTNNATGSTSWTWSCQGSNGGSTALCSEAFTPSPECSDGIDNDGDRKIDYPNDPGCSSLSDNSEIERSNPVTQCSDRLDNDRDGKIDYPSDPGCINASDDNEANGSNPQCSDGIDNDGDRKIDFPNDGGCANADDDNETDGAKAQCSDGTDNDSDGLIDYPDDLGCIDANDDNEFNASKTQCSDGTDNDFDAYIDYPDDPGCDNPSDDEEWNGIYVPQCSDLKDNDFDGLIDYPDDPGCSGPNDNNEINGSASPQCSDTIDNDGDKLVDTADPGCHSDKDPLNDASYLPSKNSEKDGIKPIFIEI
jgi:hypothetical protein